MLFILCFFFITVCCSVFRHNAPSFFLPLFFLSLSNAVQMPVLKNQSETRLLPDAARLAAKRNHCCFGIPSSSPIYQLWSAAVSPFSHFWSRMKRRSQRIHSLKIVGPQTADGSGKSVTDCLFYECV